MSNEARCIARNLERDNKETKKSLDRTSDQRDSAETTKQKEYIMRIADLNPNASTDTPLSLSMDVLPAIANKDCLLSSRRADIWSSIQRRQ